MAAADLALSLSYPRIVIVPGNGCTPVRACNWYDWLAQELRKRGFHDVILREMPDPIKARRSKWLPFLHTIVDEDTILVGHSSGAQAGLRLCEERRLRGLLLVSACVTDLGDEGERRSGYYPSRDGSKNPWDYKKTSKHTQWISQFGSRGDPFIPFSEQTTVAEGVGANFIELPPHRGHFMESTFPELADEICRRITVDKPEEKHHVGVTDKSSHEESLYGGTANRDDVEGSGDRLKDMDCRNNASKLGGNQEPPKEGVYDWLLSFRDISAILERYLPRRKDECQSSRGNDGGFSVCVVGCGTSPVGCEIAEAGMASSVWSVDYDDAVIKHMQAKSGHYRKGENGNTLAKTSKSVLEKSTDDHGSEKDRNSLRWLTADLSVNCSHILPPAFFGAVIDKGTFDAMICESGPGTDATGSAERKGGSAGSSAALMSNVVRILKAEESTGRGCGGVYVMISLHPPKLLARLIAATPLELQLEEAIVLRPGDTSRPKAEQMGCIVASFKANSTKVESEPAKNLQEDVLPERLAEGEFSVMIARRYAILPVSKPLKDDSMSWEVVCDKTRTLHAEILDNWFREVDPLLTNERLIILERTWSLLLKDSANETSDGYLSLEAAYTVMFSEDERREFTFEYFLDDIKAFKEVGAMKNGNRLSLAEAIEFLKQNQ